MQTNQPTPRERINNSQLLADTGLRIQHFHYQPNRRGDRARSFTIAYRDNHSTLDIATAIVHPNDRFCRKMGTKLAVEAFLAGKVTSIPRDLAYDYDNMRQLARPVSASHQLKRMFS